MKKIKNLRKICVCQKKSVPLQLERRTMEVKFNQTYLQELYENGRCSDKKYRFQPEVIHKYQLRIDTLMAATRKEDLFVLRSLNFEALQGSTDYSVRIDKKYRLIFALKETDAKPILTICTIKEISNHYQ